MERPGDLGEDLYPSTLYPQPAGLSWWTFLKPAHMNGGIGVAQRYGMGVLVWGPLGQGMLPGRVRLSSPMSAAPPLKVLSDERRLDAVEQLIPLAEEAGLPMAFAIATLA